MPNRPLLAVALFLAVLVPDASSAQCAPGDVTLTADRDNTLYEDANGLLSNATGGFLFAGRSGVSMDLRGLIHFDVAGGITSGATVDTATLLLVLDQPQDHDQRDISLHLVEADWGEGTSQATGGGGGEGGGGPSTTGDATWIHTFFNSATWASAGGDFDPTASASLSIDSGVNGTYAWTSPSMAADVQNWLDAPGDNFGWLVLGDESADGLALRFASRENSGSEPTLCVKLCPNLMTCDVFADGFESGNTTAWSGQVP